MEKEIEIFLNSLNSSLNSLPLFRKIVFEHHNCFKNNPFLFFFAAFQISLIKDRKYKDIFDDIESFKVDSKNYIKEIKNKFMYFNVLNNYFLNIMGLFDDDNKFNDDFYNDLEDFFQSLPTYFKEKSSDEYYNDCLKTIKKFNNRLKEKEEESELYYKVKDSLNQSIQKIEQFKNNSLNKSNKVLFKEEKIKEIKNESKNNELFFHENEMNDLNISQNNKSNNQKLIENIPQSQMNKSNIKNSSLSISNIEKNSFDSNNNSVKVINNLLKSNNSNNENNNLSKDFQLLKSSYNSNNNLLKIISSEFYTKESTYNFIIKCYDDNNYQLILVGSYSLSLIKSNESYIDFVFIPKKNTNEFISKSDIEKWIFKNNTSYIYFIQDEEINISEERVLDYLFFSGNEIKRATIYLYTNKYIVCNNIFKNVFKDNNNLAILHSFFYYILINCGLTNGSEVCFLIITFLDLNYKIFNLDKKEKKQSLIYKEKKKMIGKGDYYFYPLIEEKISQVEKIHVGLLIKEFNNFLISLINKIEPPTNEIRFLDGKYLFNIKFFYKSEFSNQVFKKLDEEINSNNYRNYKDILKNLGIKNF